MTHPFRSSIVAVAIVIATLSVHAGPRELTNGVTRVPVVFSGGHETDPRDGGRPVVLIAAALGISPKLFREAFSQVHPAPAGSEPSSARVQENKAALLAALGKHGVTNEKLDTVSNYYRYVRSRNELWPTKAAVAYALVQKGVVIGYEVTSGGSGYSSPPIVSVPNVKDATATVQLSFCKILENNGAISAITIPQGK